MKDYLENELLRMIGENQKAHAEGLSGDALYWRIAIETLEKIACDCGIHLDENGAVIYDD